MAQVRSDNILADVNKLLDDKTGVAGNNPAWRPYNDIAEFVTRFSAPSTTNLVGAAEGQFFWVRNTVDSNKADLYALRRDKTPYKVLEDIDLTAVYDAISNVLPYGLKGQNIRIVTQNSNKFSAEEPLEIGSYILNDQELSDAKEVFESQQQIFDQWNRFSHAPNLGIPASPEQTNSWEYIEAENQIFSTINSTTYIGFISNDILKDFVLKATLGASGDDNDNLTIVLAYTEDTDDMVANMAFGLDPEEYPHLDVTSEFIPNQHTLSLVRGRTTQGIGIIDGQVCRYGLVYDYRKATEKLLINADNLPWNPVFASSDYGDGQELDAEISKTDDVFTVKITNWTDAPGGKGALGFQLILDMKEDPLLDKFRGGANYGFGAYSQNDAFFKNILINNSTNQIYDLRNGDVWVADIDGIYSIDDDLNVFELLLPRTFVYNDETENLIYIKEDNTFILLNPKTKTTIIKTQDDLVDDGMDGYYLPLDTLGKDPVSIKFKITGETATYRVDISQVSEDSLWTPNVRIGGFTNNSPQTITIILI